MIYANSIKIARESRGLSQSDLSKLIGVTQATLSRFEKGVLDVTPDAVKKIGVALNYPESFFERDVRIELVLQKKSINDCQASFCT